jgi:hypothetical protein
MNNESLGTTEEEISVTNPELDNPSLNLLNDQAKVAYEFQDPELSKRTHEQKSSVTHHKEKHNVYVFLSFNS